MSSLTITANEAKDNAIQINGVAILGETVLNYLGPSVALIFVPSRTRFCPSDPTAH